MKPVLFKVRKSSSALQATSTGPIVAKIIGSTKKLGQRYQDAMVVLYNKANLQPIAIRKPDMSGNYEFLGLNTDIKTFVVAFDQNQKYNAVIQNNVVPK